MLLIAALISAIGLTLFLSACEESPQSPLVQTEDKTAEVTVEESVKEGAAEIPAEEIFAEVKTEKTPEPKKEETPPPPSEEPKEEETVKANTCFISVKCDTILNNKELLPEEKWELVPAEGKILAEREVSFRKDESAFEILLRVLKEERIHIEFMTTPIYDSVYIEGIGNIYEMDCGKLSGWMYKVNGAFLQTSSSAYMPENGDKIEWVYTCDAGKDVSAESVTE